MSHHDEPHGAGRRTPGARTSVDRPRAPRQIARGAALLAAAVASQVMPLSVPAVMTTLLVPLGLTLLAPRVAQAQITVSIRVGPPPLPFYVQPTLAGEGYLWLPGYWAWNAEDFDYFWVPGTWALAPQPGLLWTPGWWGFESNAYRWHAGYWAERVGYYGGIDYGHGYSGYGYQGGRWEGGQFHYNTSVNNVSGSAARYTYRSTSFSNHNSNRASFNGGLGGVNARPTPVEVQQQSGRRAGPTANQLQHEHQALRTTTQRQSNNRGAPPVAATPRPNEFNSPGAVKSHATPPHKPERQAPTQQQRQQDTKPGQRGDEPQRHNRGQQDEDKR